jgi:hypothetical protein
VQEKRTSLHGLITSEKEKSDILTTEKQDKEVKERRKNGK